MLGRLPARTSLWCGTTVEEVAAHDTRFFAFVTDPDGPGPLQGFIQLTPQDEADMVAYMKLLD
jgi:hypothetical protein